MSALRQLLLVICSVSLFGSVVGCGDKETVVTGTEEEIKDKFPGPPETPGKK